MSYRNLVLVLILGSTARVQYLAQSKPENAPPAMSSHHAGVNPRGDKAMGFSQEKTTHHFRLYADGGAIEVQVNDPKDSTSRDHIRGHLAHIAQMFSAGNFSAPMLVHDRVPPGVPTMQRLKDAISYQYEQSDRGGTLRIKTQNAEALRAVHQFLRYQITDHQTGDSLQVGKVKE